MPGGKRRLLVVDVGNTHIVLGLYEGDTLSANFRIDTRQHRTKDEFAVIVSHLFALENIDINGINDLMVACVVPPIQRAVVQFLEELFGCKPLVLGPGIKSGVIIKVDDPREVGADRIANSAGALALYKPPLILVDFGTAITIDAISEKGEYLGGAIVPGVRLSLDALHKRAARLPDVAFARPVNVIGTNTVAAMQSGAFYGFASLVDGLVTKMQNGFDKKATVIATGGEAMIVAPASDCIDHVEEELTLLGLKVIYEKNR